VALKATVLYHYDKRLQRVAPARDARGSVAQSGERLNSVARDSNCLRTEVAATVRPGAP
jgi:hypothetical protein